MKLAVSIAFVLVAAYIGYGMLLYFKQRSLLYFPTPAFKHAFEEVTFDTGETIRVIVVNPGQRDALLYFGGNAEPVAMSAADFESGYPERTVYLVNYRGYGGSTGSPTEAGHYQDALFVYDQVAPRHNRVSAMGRSLGSGVATYLATHRALDRLILITPFDSVVNVARTFFPVYPVTMLVKDKYDSIGRAPEIDTRTLIVIAENDEVIPPRHARQLADAFRSNVVATHTLPGTNHNNLSLHPAYTDIIRTFLVEGKALK
jgi:pimeloyl-ACP methyl ester carboxylesterase